MERRKYKSATIVLGLATALLVVFSQLFFYQGAELCKKEVKIEKKESSESQDSKNESIVSLPSFTVQAACSVHLSHEAVLLFEIFSSENKRTVISHDIPVALGKYFLTLFRIIIAPNAP
jgi:hypothetical protein